MAVEKRATFNQVAELYARVRPTYPDQLFDDLVALSGIPAGGRVLEIGAGTGIATLPFAQRGYDVVAVELGADLAAVAAAKVAAFESVEVVVADFERWPLPAEPFDLVTSATAWHWVDPAVSYRKAAEALRRDGALAVFGYHHVAGGDQEFFEQAHECYLRFMPDTPPDFVLIDAAECQPELEALAASGLFTEPEIRTYLTEETYSRSRYLDLLSTYSGHRVLDEQARTGLLDCIGSLIDRRFGGQVRKRYLADLIVSRKKAG